MNTTPKLLLLTVLLFSFASPAGTPQEDLGPLRIPALGEPANPNPEPGLPPREIIPDNEVFEAGWDRRDCPEGELSVEGLLPGTIPGSVKCQGAPPVPPAAQAVNSNSPPFPSPVMIIKNDPEVIQILEDAGVDFSIQP